MTSVALAGGCDVDQPDQPAVEDADNASEREAAQRGLIGPRAVESDVEAVGASEADDDLAAPAILPRTDLGGGWTLEPAGTSLYVKYADLTVARFSVGWDRFLVFRDLNGAPPYFYFNQNGDFGVYYP